MVAPANYSTHPCGPGLFAKRPVVDAVFLAITVDELGLLISGYNNRRAGLAIQARKQKGAEKEATVAQLAAVDARIAELLDLLDRRIAAKSEG